MRTSGSRAVCTAAVSAAPSRCRRVVSRALSSAAARRLPTSSSSLSGSPPERIRRAADASSRVVFPVPGPPTTRSGPASWSRTHRAAASHSGSGTATRGGRTSRGALASSTTSGPGTTRFDHVPPTVPGSGAGHDRGMDDATVERVRALVRAIPPGPGPQLRRDRRRRRGSARPAWSAALLAVDGHDLPWHRVVRANGTFAPHLAVGAGRAAAGRGRPRHGRPRPGRPPPPPR